MLCEWLKENKKTLLVCYLTIRSAACVGAVASFPSAGEGSDSSRLTKSPTSLPVPPSSLLF